MRNDRVAVRLGVFLILAVVLPSVILSLLALRAVNHEALYIEKQLKSTLAGELNSTALLLKVELSRIQEELGSTLRFSADSDFEQVSLRWKRDSSLVESPFLVSKQYEILWPKPDGEFNRQDYSFLKANRDFLADEVRIPVYKNIAVAYEKEILKDVEAASKQVTKNTRVQQSAPQFLESDSWLGRTSSYRSQQAQTAFEQEPQLRKKVYAEAQSQGQQINYRKIQSSVLNKNEVSDQLQTKNEESIFISEPQRFSQIIAGAQQGITPRFIDDRLRLLFWKKNNNGMVSGCLLNQNALNDRLVGILPPIYTSTRILTVLDENGQPLITPQEKKGRDWRKPFVSQEVSEMLPHWEVAAYLTDPGVVSSKARFAAMVIWFFIAILFISIISGGTLILRSIHNEVMLARQKTTFVTNVSHELKTPLTSLRMFTEMLKEKTNLDEEKRKKYLEIMASETERLTRLINNVLDFSRMERNKKNYSMKTVDIASLCKDLLQGQRIRLENAGFTITFVSAGVRILVTADEEALKQAILNLLFNAEKYSPQTKAIEIEVACEGQSAVILVKDRGIGVKALDRHKIFEEFYRVDDSLSANIKGTGLGLSITRRIINDHNGTVVCLARENAGSIFKIILPQCKETV